jgi:hypothetical protein
MSSVPTTAAAPDGRQAAISEAARRLYDAEVALHIARQTGVAAWISAAYDRLHEAIAGHTAAVGSAGTADPPELRPQPARPGLMNMDGFGPELAQVGAHVGTRRPRP